MGGKAVPLMEVEVRVPEGEVFSGQAQFLRCRGTEGQLGILPRHSPIVTMLAIGEAMIRSEDGEEIYLAVGGGLLFVTPEQVLMLATTAERGEEIDRERAERAKREVEARLKDLPPDEDRERLQAALKRAQIRLEVAERRH